MLTRTSSATHLRGSITNAGPCKYLHFSCPCCILTSLSVVDAKIDFPAGLDVAWQGNMFGNIKIDAVKVTGDVGATLDNDSTFNVVDLGTLTEFTKVCLVFWILYRWFFSHTSS